MALTTSGTFTAPHIPELKALSIHSVNISLDTLDERRFSRMTRRNNFQEVIRSFHSLLRYNIPNKINAVIMEVKNEEDIFAFLR
ncbi:MAG: radical SAM protein [Crocinitomicaceae bacterium]|nr:radical SAM protein [Crocinitomicaceae bacterium]